MVNYTEIVNIFTGETHKEEAKILDILKSQGNVYKIEDQGDTFAVFYEGKVDDFSCVVKELHKLKIVMVGFRVQNNKTTLVWFTSI